MKTQDLLDYEIGRMNLCQPLFRRWSVIDGETVMSMAFKQFVSFRIFGKSDTVFQAASDAEAAQVRERRRSLEESSFDPTLALEIPLWMAQELLYYEIGRRSLCQPLFLRWSIIDGETVMSMSFKQFVSSQISGKSTTVFQAASDAEAAYVVVIDLEMHTVVVSP